MEERWVGIIVVRFCGRGVVCMIFFIGDDELVGFLEAYYYSYDCV